MPFQVGIGFLGGTVFFQVGLCTPLRTMNVNTYTALCDSFCITCCIFAAWIALQLSQVYDHTILIFLLCKL